MTRKTNKSIAKRFKVTKNKKVLFRPLNQNHYNANDSGNQTRKKRKLKRLTGAIAKKVIKELS